MIHSPIYLLFNFCSATLHISAATIQNRSNTVLISSVAAVSQTERHLAVIVTLFSALCPVCTLALLLLCDPGGTFLFS